MIRVRVDWRQECPGCGTEIVSDFLDDSICRITCPWCGCENALREGSDNSELREYLAQMVREIEAKANNGIAV